MTAEPDSKKAKNLRKPGIVKDIFKEFYSNKDDELLFSPELEQSITSSQTFSDAGSSQMSDQNQSSQSHCFEESLSSSFLTQDASQLHINSQNNTSAIDVSEDLQIDITKIKKEPKSDDDLF